MNDDSYNIFLNEMGSIVTFNYNEDTPLTASEGQNSPTDQRLYRQRVD